MRSMIVDRIAIVIVSAARKKQVKICMAECWINLTVILINLPQKPVHKEWIKMDPRKRMRVWLNFCPRADRSNLLSRYSNRIPDLVSKELRECQLPSNLEARECNLFQNCSL